MKHPYSALYLIKITDIINEEVGMPYWVSIAGIFNGFKCTADTDVLNKTKHKSNTAKWKYGLCKIKLYI